MAAKHGNEDGEGKNDGNKLWDGKYGNIKKRGCRLPVFYNKF